MKNILLAVLAVTGFLFGQGQVARAQILTNGSFEANSATIGTGKTQTGFGGITGWQNIGMTAFNSGVQYGATGTTFNQSQSGTYFAFQDSDDSTGNKGAFQITSTALQAGDHVTLTWYALNAFGTPIQNIDLLSASTTGASFGSASILTPTNTPVLTLATTYAKYTLTYTATAGDAGKFLGISFSTTGATNSFVQYDNFVMTDVAAVPEPSSYALGLIALGALVAVSRFRRTA